MGLEEYNQLVERFGGITFGHVTQDTFILEANKKALGYTERFLQSLSESLLHIKKSNPHALLNVRGVCNGLVQAFYQHVIFHSDRLKAISEFGHQLNTFDLALAKKSAALQAIDSDLYTNADMHDFRKSLGLDLEEESRFVICENEKAKQRAETMMAKLANKKLVKVDGEYQFVTVENPLPSTTSLAKTTTLVQPPRDKMIDYLVKAAENDLIRLNLQFLRDGAPLLSERLDGHAISFFKFKNPNSEKMYFVFYDPNAVPTLFDDEANFKKFVKQYIDNITLSFKTDLDADSVEIIAGKYTNQTHEFHNVLRLLQTRIKEKLASIPEQIANSEFITQLHLLMKRCDYADRFGILYQEESHIKLDSNDNTEKAAQIIQDLSKHKRKFYPNKDLLKLIKVDIKTLKNFDADFSTELMKIANAESLQTMQKKKFST